ncbi:MAG: formate dehydrogenase accessory sulfurtransferase FdhD [Candidatus Hydrogenedentes bacterium]|nr:formate dehydrogenase accessory sulfurtransferase FdhD [Candidatus Hydrogenedentota bacterium]
MQTKSFSALRTEETLCERGQDILAVEAPVHVKVNGIPYTTTVRTPGEDRAFIRGLLYTEGIVPDPEARIGWREVVDPESGLAACVEVTVPTSQVAKDIEGRRSAMGSASCGFCGIREPREIMIAEDPLRPVRDGRLHRRQLPEMVASMQAAQSVFAATGGCHAAAAFAASGQRLAAAEDIGRHNAVDKVVGYLLDRRQLEQVCALVVSGRVSYEIVYKAYQAQIPVVIGLSAVSSLAVEMGGRFGITVAGFCRGGRATIYAHEHRITSE